MNINEHRVREFAYQIWESEGRPNGQEERHWEMACKLADAHADGDGQLEASIDKADKIFLPGETSVKKSRSKTKSANASSLEDAASPAHATVGKPPKTKKPKSTEEISA
jgi:hypothetical protein